MKKTYKYFVGQLDKVKRGSPFRIFRQRKNLLGVIVDEVSTKTGFKRMKKGYKKVGVLVNSRDAARADKRMWEGKGAR